MWLKSPRALWIFNTSSFFSNTETSLEGGEMDMCIYLLYSTMYCIYISDWAIQLCKQPFFFFTTKEAEANVKKPKAPTADWIED